VEVVNHGNPAQVEQVLAGTAVAGPAALPVTHVGEGVPNLGTLAPLCTPARGLLALRRPAARYRAAERHALTYDAEQACGASRDGDGRADPGSRPGDPGH
jgi:hypothetical protein